ncbi:protein phosphatase 2C domain-containing protein [Corallincola platygyrae]
MFKLVSYGNSHPGKVRTHNEDAFLELPEYGVWMVADGMGGHSAGDVASQMLVDTVLEVVQQVPKGRLSIDLLSAAIQQANARIYEYGQRYQAGSTVGSTAALLFIDNGLFHCLWAGDSRFYVLRQGRLSQKSRDHSQVMDMVDEGTLALDEVESHPLSNVITRAVGVGRDLRLDQVSGIVLPEDRFLLCSDGLNKELSDEDILRCMDAESLTNASLALLHSALVKGASDNVTTILVDIAKANVESDGQKNDDTVPIFDAFG